MRGRRQIRNILTIVVDDENRIRRGIERLVEASGEEFIVVGSFKSAVELFNQYEKEPFAFDLLLTDIRMPGLDGLELITEMRKRTSFEAIVISGFNDFKYLQTAIRAGAIDYLVKPIVREDFREQLMKVKEKIKLKWMEEEKLEKKDAELQFIKQCQQLSELTRGGDVDLSELEWTKSFQHESYHLYYLSKDQPNTDSRMFEEWNQAVTIAIHSVIENRCQYWFWMGEESTYWLLAEDKNGEMELAKQLQAQLKLSTHSPHTIAISGRFHDVALLGNMKKNLEALMQLRLLYGGNRVFTFSDIERNVVKKGKDSKGLDISINKILQSFEQQKKEETFELLDQLLIDLKAVSSPQEMERCIQSLSVQAVNVLLKDSSTVENVYLIQEAISFTRKSASFTVLRDNLTKWMEKIYQLRLKKQQQEDINPIHVAKRWIKNNIGGNITIDKIAREIPMNPTYFCEYFKNQTGETILDYVTKTRIEKSKELLITTDLKIYDIALKVGYADTKYFSKLFKKYFGEVPSKYKEKVKSEY